MKTLLDPLIRRLRWVMLGVVLFDVGTTLVGQPKRFWTSPVVAQEHNTFVRPFLAQGGLAFVLWALLYAVLMVSIVSVAPRRLALIVLLSVILGHFYGACTWWVYSFGYGTQAAVIYGILLSTLLVLCGVGGRSNGSAEPMVR